MFLNLEEFNDSQDSIEEVTDQPSCTTGEICIDNLTAYWSEGTTEVRLNNNNNLMSRQRSPPTCAVFFF